MFNSHKVDSGTKISDHSNNRHPNSETFSSTTSVHSSHLSRKELLSQSPILNSVEDSDQRDDGTHSNKSRSSSKPKRASAKSTQPEESSIPTPRTVIPKLLKEQNRKTRGTWHRKFDFTRTILGYVVGLHNFFRFPYMYYKFGVLFFMAYLIAMWVVGMPIVFLEFTIGQYYGVSSSVAFAHMSPILGGISKLITWSCILNGWIYTVMTAWIRLYSGDANSCIRGWEVCIQEHYYNTPNCYTGSLDDQCNDISMADHHGLDINVVIGNDMLYYNFKCRTIDYYCKAHGWKSVPGKRVCVNERGMKHSIYSRRYHASQEFFYGIVLGLKRAMDNDREKTVIESTLKVTNLKNLSDVVAEIHKRTNSTMAKQRDMILIDRNPNELIRVFHDKLRSGSQKDRSQLDDIMEDVWTHKNQQRYWTKEGQQLCANNDSSALFEFRQLIVTTWVMIAVFLFEDLLEVSFFSYILNAVPVLFLLVITVRALNFEYAWYGLKHVLAFRKDFLSDLFALEMWTEAVIQAIYTTGIGNGVLISLATFNNFDHNYMTDLYCSMICSVLTSVCGVLVVFCSLGDYAHRYNIDVPFGEFWELASSSSVEFCYTAMSIFLTSVSDSKVFVLMYFFMLTSFASDTTIRLVEHTLDTVMNISSRLNPNRTVVLVAVCLMGVLLLVPMMKNGGFVFFVEIEYFTFRFVMPTIVMLELAACAFIYKASRILDNSEQMGVIKSYSYRILLTVQMYVSVVVLLGVIIGNFVCHTKHRFNGLEEEIVHDSVGWTLYASTILVALMAVVEQLIVVHPSRWVWLCVPLKRPRKIRQAFVKRVGVKKPDEQTDEEAIRDAAMRWAQLEAELRQAMIKNIREKRNSRKSRGSTSSRNSAQFSTLKSLDKVRIYSKGSTSAQLQDKNSKNQESSMASWGGVASTGHSGISDDYQSDKNRSKHSSKKQTGKKSRRRLAFAHVKNANLFSKLMAAMSGKALANGKYYHARRHVGGGTRRKLVTRENPDGTTTTVLEDDDDEGQSDDSLISYEDEDATIEKKMEPLNEAMDYISKWPGRLDESELESQGSTSEESLSFSELDSDN